VALLIGDLLADAAAVAPAAPAVTLGERALSYSELDDAANRTAHVWHGMGIGAGDVVAWWTRPTLAAVAAFAATARLGAVFAPLNPVLGRGEAADILEYLHPRLLVVDPAHAELVADELAGGDLPFAITGAGAAGVSMATRRAWPALDLDAATAAAHGSPFVASVPISDDDPHVIYLTSGTTGRPKGVVVSHRASWLRSFPGGSTFSVGLRGPGGILASFPLFHYGGWHYVLEAWHHRCCVHLSERFDGPGLVGVADRWKPTGMYCIPAVWGRVLEACPSGPELASVRHADTGTSAAPLELLERLRDRLPEATTSVLYGSSEGGHHTTLADWDIARKPGSVGRVAPPGVIRCGPDGEILYRSPTLMLGYFELPEETAKALAGGWYHTGDLGLLDEERYVYVTGRVREVIRTGGEYVAPTEVEAALFGYPGLADLAVVGIADDRWGEVVCAVVVPLEGSEAPTVAALRDHIGAALAPFKHPRRVVVAGDIPRTAATRQVQRTLLRERIGLAPLDPSPPGPFDGSDPDQIG
jgi:fatty-acyl-CoA synthase